MGIMMAKDASMKAFPEGDNLFQWKAVIIGAPGTVRERERKRGTRLLLPLTLIYHDSGMALCLFFCLFVSFCHCWAHMIPLSVCVIGSTLAVLRRLEVQVDHSVSHRIPVFGANSHL